MARKNGRNEKKMSDRFQKFNDVAYGDHIDDDLDYELYDDCGNPYPECHWQPGLGCDMAGSEDCDFDCPNRCAMIADLESHLKRRKRKVK
jgi:hypothetical protein